MTDTGSLLFELNGKGLGNLIKYDSNDGAVLLVEQCTHQYENEPCTSSYLDDTAYGWAFDKNKQGNRQQDGRYRMFF